MPPPAQHSGKNAKSSTTANWHTYYEMHQKTILGGDFNCILEKTDSTGIHNYGQALAELIQGFKLQDSWQGNPSRKAYIHYSASGATRIDRIYLSQEMFTRKLSMEAAVAAFTEHLAVCLRLNIDVPILRRGQGLWKIIPFSPRTNASWQYEHNGSNCKSRNHTFRTQTCGGIDIVRIKSGSSSKRSRRSDFETSETWRITIMNVYKTCYVTLAPTAQISQL